eukprot:1152079-Pelagomonas_calceolata.AAC.2
MEPFKQQLGNHRLTLDQAVLTNFTPLPSCPFPGFMPYSIPSCPCVRHSASLPSHMLVRQQEAEAACHALRDQLAAAKQRSVQLESGLRARNREIDKAHKATESSQAAQSAAELRAAEVCWEINKAYKARKGSQAQIGAEPRAWDAVHYWCNAAAGAYRTKGWLFGAVLIRKLSA